ncbi:HNH endonuclease [Paraburkholderia sp. BCC1884]|uniref:HNH endonuclease n=1 Tax=Paraburkholderia sp. BCC1884 TaxID=2562668 RepID=UPI00118453CF|nr:HNH endonuclease [Paraburkholderia sp. BCC1884]
MIPIRLPKVAIRPNGNVPVEPRHFTAGGLCFDLLRAAGYQIIRKGKTPPSPGSNIDKERPEGAAKLEAPLSLETNAVKTQVWALADEINAALGKQRIEPHQQNVATQNISLIGSNKGERLYIKPARHGYSVGLGGNSLVDRMEPFMKRLTGRERDGYAHPHVSRQPYWHLSDYAQVREAAYEFAAATFLLDGNETATDVVAIERREDLTRTQRETLIQARLGQGTYRKQMLELWDGQCAVTGLTIQSALIASHAKPWAESTDEERLDPLYGTGT